MHVVQVHEVMLEEGVVDVDGELCVSSLGGGCNGHNFSKDIGRARVCHHL